MSDDTLLLFSSDQREVYKGDIYTTTSAPPGHGFRFRYQNKWIEPKLAEEISKRSDCLVGEDAIIIAQTGRQGSDSGSQSTKTEYVPLRKAKITQIESYSDTTYLDLKLTNQFVNYTSGNKTFQQYDHSIKDLELSPENESFVTKSDDISFELTNDGDSDEPFEWTAWEKLEPEWTDLIDILCDREGNYSDAFYYRLVEIRPANDSDMDLKFRDIGGSTTRGPKLKDDTEYEFKMSFYYPTEQNKEQFDFSLSSTSKGEIFPSEISSGFKTDQRNFHFTPKKSFDKRVFSIEGRIDGDASLPEGPKLNIPAELKPPKWQKHKFLLKFAFGLALAAGLLNPIIGGFGVIPLPEGDLEMFAQLFGVFLVTYILNLYSTYL